MAKDVEEVSTSLVDGFPSENKNKTHEKKCWKISKNMLEKKNTKKM